MAIKIRKLNKRLRSKKECRHKPSGRGKGKWHDLDSLWAYKKLSRRKRLIAKASRRWNRTNG